MVLLQEILKQWMIASSPIKINTEPFKEWRTNILFMAKADTLLQGMDGCNKSGEINRISLKKLECLR